jgi:hypothetical protein
LELWLNFGLKLRAKEKCIIWLRIVDFLLVKCVTEVVLSSLSNYHEILALFFGLFTEMEIFRFPSRVHSYECDGMMNMSIWIGNEEEIKA